MFNRTKTNPQLAEAIDKCLEQFKLADPGTPEYTQAVDNLVKLYAIADTQRNRVDANQAVAVAANLTGIIAILNYERLHAMTSKAFGFLVKSRV